MKSPFLGMDPFIEGCGLWEDFHNHLIEKIFDSLADIVPSNYVVRTGERGYIVLAGQDGELKHSFRPDVSVADETEGTGSRAALALADTETNVAPFVMRAFVEEEFRETFVEIHETEGAGRLVTCIEVLSPSNKRPNSPGWDLYQRKRQSLLLARTANLVEIDLLRGGTRMPMDGRWPESPYAMLVARRTKMPTCKVWDVYSLRPVPPLPVPLFKPDLDVTIELQPLIDSIYKRARYGQSIDYARPLVPPLNAEEKAWLEQQLRQGNGTP